MAHSRTKKPQGIVTNKYEMLISRTVLNQFAKKGVKLWLTEAEAKYPILAKHLELVSAGSTQVQKDEPKKEDKQDSKPVSKKGSK